jgi:hypothetical protein
MKKLLTIIGILLVCVSTNAQSTLVIDQSIVQSAPYRVGDTITMKYTIAKNGLKPRYFWLRYDFNNKALEYVPNTTVFSQGAVAQTYFTSWNNYAYNGSNPLIGVGDLYGQYKATPWGYTTNNDWNTGQLTVQRTDTIVDGTLATQKFIIKDKSSFEQIHKLHMAYAINDTSGYVPNIGSAVLYLSIPNSSIIGNTSQFKVRVLYPSNYTNITDHAVQLMPLKSDGSGKIDWTKQPILIKSLDASGEAVFTSGIKVGDSVGVFIGPAFQKSFMNDIITVSDAYKAFLGISEIGITGASSYFTYPSLENRVGNITIGDTTFNESDSYYLFSYIMGIDVSSKARIPSSTATSITWASGLLNQNWLNGSPDNRVKITNVNQSVDAVYAWGGDLNWSHSSHPDTIANRISTNNYVNSTNVIKSMSVSSMAYAAPVLEKATLSLSSKLENGKVVLSAGLTKADLAGLEVIMQYDSTKLTLTDVIFDAGSTITNFSTHNNGRLTFGSIDQLKTARIKVGTPYKLIFTPKETLTNTAGLFYTVLADAVDAKGNKIDLVIE